MRRSRSDDVRIRETLDDMLKLSGQAKLEHPEH